MNIRNGQSNISEDLIGEGRDAPRHPSISDDPVMKHNYFSSRKIVILHHGVIRN